MADITTVWNSASSEGDWQVATPFSYPLTDSTGSTMLDGGGSAVYSNPNYTGFTPGLVAGGDLETAVLISLFTDAEAEASDVIPDGSGDRRGWWGDLDQDVPIGSKLWLLSRSKQTAATLAAAQNYISDALQWLIDDGVAASIDLDVEWNGPGFLAAAITIHRPTGGPSVFQYQWAWAGIS